MSQKAKLFKKKGSQAVRLPDAFRFEGNEVFIRRDEDTGDIILSKKLPTWDAFLETLQGPEVPDDFLNPDDRKQEQSRPDPFDDWDESNR